MRTPQHGEVCRDTPHTASLWTAAETRAWLRLGRSAFYQLVVDGVIPAIDIGRAGRAVLRFDPAVVEAAVKGRRRTRP